MRTADLFKLARTYLSRRKTRTLLTVLGVIIGTACIVLMFSIGLSNYNQFKSMLEDDASLTQITINNYSSGGAQGRGGLTDSTLTSIAGIEHVKAVSPLLRFPAIMRTGKYEAMTSVTGVDPAVLMLEFEQGELFASGGGMPMLVIGAEAKKQFMDPKNPVSYADWEAYEQYEPEIDWMNAQIELTPGYETDDPEFPKGSVYRAAVSGTLKKAQNESSNSIYMDLAAAKKMLMDNRALADAMGVSVSAYTEVVVRVDAMENVQAVMDEVKKLGYETYSPVEYISQMREEQGRQQGQLLAIGFISLFVSAIGIANTMYASILERKSDIGVMKVVGMKVKKIRRLFLIESSLIGLLGGAIGIAASFIITVAINTSTEQTSFLGMYFSQGMKIEIPVWLALGAIGIAVLVGIASGVYPAYKATKMSPLEAMRSGN